MKVFVNHDRGLAKDSYLEYIKNAQNSTEGEPSNPIRKGAKDTKRPFP
jgi:hypothetical protein